MLVIIGPHSLNTIQARVIIDVKLYCDDVMGGALCATRRRTPLPYTTTIQGYTTLYNVIQDYTTQYKAILQYTTLYSVIQDYTTLYDTTQ
jgi:hypothetical protein